MKRRQCPPAPMVTEITKYFVSLLKFHWSLFMGVINTISELVSGMAWRGIGSNRLLEPMINDTNICRHVSIFEWLVDITPIWNVIDIHEKFLCEIDAFCRYQYMHPVIRKLYQTWIAVRDIYTTRHIHSSDYRWQKSCAIYHRWQKF